jgi:YidC/Oxa1 family membrane protein insertase
LYSMLLTKSTTFLIGPIATLLGYLMNGIFWLLNKIGLPNIGVAIILLTVVIYMALMPLTIKQQKFSKLQSKMMPEIKKIQEKYKNKKDQDSMMKQNEETQAVYKKYGVSATGSCAQLLIQMPILFALYQVIYHIPAYVDQVKAAFDPVIAGLLSTSGASDYLAGTKAASQFAKQFTADNFVNNVGDTVKNTFIDVLNRFSTTDWANLKVQFPSLSSSIDQTSTLLNRYNNFLGLNMGDSPWYSMKAAFAVGAWGVVIGAVMIPVLSAVSQWISIKLTPTSQPTGDQQQDSMMASMKTMNIMMPLMSAWFCFTLPAGMGLYWIAGAVIRTLQQIYCNKQIDKMDIDAMVAKNMAKEKEKAEKSGGRKPVSQRLMSEYASMNTRSISGDSSEKPAKPVITDAQKEEALKKAEAKYAGGKYKKNSLTAHANMVKDFNNVQNSDGDSN